MRQPTPRSIGPAVVLALLSFLVTVSLKQERRAAADAAERRAQLARVVELRQARAERLETRLADLRRRLEAAAARSGAEEIARLRALSSSVALLGGRVPVTGPGLVVEVADAKGTDASADPDLRVQDVDIQAVVNALWAAGAEAVSVGGQRLVSTTAIRNAGAAVLVNYRVLSSPYRIEAIGDRRTLRESFERSEIAAHFREWSELFGLGFSVRESTELRLPAYTGTLTFRYARTLQKR